MYEPHTKPLLSRVEFAHRLLRHVGLVGGLLAVSLLIGIAGYTFLAHMSLVDAFVDASMLLGGMGPVGELKTTPAKIFAGCYALYAGLVFIASAGILTAPVAHRIMHNLHIDDRKT
ncbi:MAG: hypothetical protein ABI652_05465 [Acidobacteriota bacterium]